VALLLKRGRVVDPALGLDEVADVLIRDGRIVEIGPDLTMPKGITIECAEKVVLPSQSGSWARRLPRWATCERRERSRSRTTAAESRTRA